MMRVRGGYAALYSAAFLFAFTSLLVKLASRYYSGMFVSAARFAAGTILCTAVLAWGYRSLKPARPGLVALRGIFGAFSMAMSYAAISLTGPGRAALLANTYPLFVAVFGALFFGERIGPRVFVCIAICSCGAILVMRDGSGASLTGDLIAIGSAVFAGIAINLVRRATQADNPFMLYLSPCLFGLPLFAFVPAGNGGTDSNGGTVGILFLVGVGVTAFLAQALMAYGYRSVQAGKGSVVFYFETALTVLLGALFAGERFNLRFAAGLTLIIGGLVLNHVKPRPEGARSARRRGFAASLRYPGHQDENLRRRPNGQSGRSSSTPARAFSPHGLQWHRSFHRAVP
jgi:drug/metabolite transporter (DMT)-like permease